jgi:Glycosyl hydrolases family 16
MPVPIATFAAVASAALLPLALLIAPAAEAQTNTYEPTGDGTGWTLVNNYGGQEIYDDWQTYTLIGRNCTEKGSISVDSNNDLELTTNGGATNCAEVTSPFTVSPTAAEDVFIEYKAEVPGDTWAALWSTGAPGPWPYTGEIDTAEVLRPSTECHSFHYEKSAGREGTLGGPTDSHACSGGFNHLWTTFGVQWSTTSLTFFVDGVEFRQSLSGSAITSNPEEVIMDNLGASWDAGGGSTMLIQYVRTWIKRTPTRRG